jgi:rhodanese-related sulfurtransferase
MKGIYYLLAILLIFTGCAPAKKTDNLQEAAKRLTEGKAVLVDVREPDEWADTGVAEPAILLSKSSFDAGSPEWKAFLDRNRGTEIILMCRSGNRSGQLARVLERQGLRTTNLGGFSAWKKAGLPVRHVD